MSKFLVVINIISFLCVFAYVHALVLAIVMFMSRKPDDFSELFYNLLNIWLVIYPLFIAYGSSKFFSERSGSNIKKLMFYTFISVSGPLPLVVFI